MLELLSLAIPSFFAGLLTFLAPCTLPLVPGYLGFISGVSTKDLQDPEKAHTARRKIFMNGLLYVIGFSVVFIVLGSLVGLGGAALIQHRILLGRIGGVFIIIFGLYMLNALKLNFLNFLGGEHRIPIMNKLRPGTPLSSLIFGSTFALGWTPCVGPILGSVLVLAASSATVGQGTVLLAVFSLGLALPFLFMAAAIGWLAPRMQNLTKYLHWVSVIGGIFLVFLGVLLVMNRLGFFISWFFQVTRFLNIEERLYDYL